MRWLAVVTINKTQTKQNKKMHGAHTEMDDIWHIHQEHSASHVLYRPSVLIDFQIMEGGKDGAMDAKPSIKALSI